MKPTQLTELLANIKATFVSFFSILMFVALGVGIFAGISWSSPALQAAADSVFDSQRLHHFQVQYPYGLTVDDMEALLGIEGIEAVEGVQASLQTLHIADKPYTVEIQTVGTDIDVLEVKEGRLPTQADEVAWKASSAEQLGLAVGDTVAFEHDATTSRESDEDGMAYLTHDAFTITALVESPAYLALSSSTYGFSTSGSGTVDALAWVPASSFDFDAFQKGYTVVNVRSSSLQGLGTFSDAYARESGDLAARIESLGETLAPARYRALHDDAEQQLADGEEQLADADAQVADGWKQVGDAQVQIIEGESQIADGEDQLANSRAQIADGEAELAVKQSEFDKKAAARKKLAAAKKKLDKAKKQFDAASEQLEKALEELPELKRAYEEKESAVDAAQAAVDAAQEQLDALLSQRAQDETDGATDEQLAAMDDDIAQAENALAAAQDKLAQAQAATIPIYGQELTLDQAQEAIDLAEEELPKVEAELAEKESELEAGKKAYNKAKKAFDKEVAAAKKKLADARKQLDSAQEQADAGAAQLEQARQEVASGRAHVAETTAQLEEAEDEITQKSAELDDAREKLESMKEYAWTVSGRSYNGGVSEAAVLGGTTDNLSWSMAALFVIVGLLVSYSAISRIVHEQITQIGTKKALGLRRREITAGFLAYAALAVVAGSIVGLVVGVLAVEGIIGHALGERFTLGDYPPYFNWGLGLAATAIELALVLGATWLACRSILREQAVELLKGEKPPEGKTRFFEKWRIWDRLPLYTQTIVNNCLNDKRRVFSTIVGVAGCTALVVTAITLNDDVLASFDRHYEDVYGFDAIAYVDEGDDWALISTDRELREQGAQTARALVQRQAIELPDGGLGVARLVVPKAEQAFGALYHVNPVAGSAFDPSAEGVWVSRAYAVHLGAQVGDEIVVNGSDGARHHLTIAGIYEYYLTQHEMVLGADYYEQMFGEAASPNAVLADTGGSTEAMTIPLQEIDGSQGLVDDKGYQQEAFTAFAGISRTVVMVYLALSVLMAIVVLLNLNVMFIDEKKRELIVLMINGFSVKDAKRYIYNDTIVLTALGIVLGIVLGAVMGAVTVSAVEPSSAFFLKDVDWRAVLAGAVTSAVLALVMSLVALRRIPRFNLTDINKL